MGNWSTRTRRGGGGASPTSAVLLSVTVIASDTVRLTFSAPVVVMNDPAPGQFEVAGQDPDTASNHTTTQVDVVIAGPTTVGDSYALNDGSWMTPTPPPASGICI